MFTLARGKANITAEVQRWQYFLRRQGYDQVGNIDGDFGINTETTTKFFQVKHNLVPNGEVDAPTLNVAATRGYTILPQTYYSDRRGGAYPPRPTGLSSPSNATRNRDFGCFTFLQHPRPPRPDKEAIVITASCDRTVPDWVGANIVEMPVPQLRFARGYNGRIRCHRLAAPVIKALFEAWEQADLLHLILSYDGCFVPRYKRKQAPSPTLGHNEKKSADVEALSNHAFGSAFDINAADNPLGEEPAECGDRGSVRELVAAANAVGIYWGGHFGTEDGMHFEISALTGALATVASAASGSTLPSSPPLLAVAAPAAQPADAAIHWFKTTFGGDIAAATAGTPFSINLIAAIAMQETSYIWRRIYKTHTVAEVLAACTGDTLDAPRRSAFPKTRADLEAVPDGKAMFALARAALLNVAQYDPDLKKVAKKPDKFCHGFGMFQYDLQFFKVDPDYFLEEKWKTFSGTLEKCVEELKIKLVRTYGKDKTSLTHDESVYVAIAYNTGRANLKKDFKQGYRDSNGVYYGEYIDRFMSLAEKS
ncbi:M15 family metallopeptidase [Methylobacterium isbiliense]|uniref:Peptidoglycan binding-like domain-containing protein n=1 Tax=Methylobacterium isbiliense TaxID=315478 RepID=A0ABQ4S8W8_9HYPH|nr:M15 family metallopeptidase [Methylobacterium isbiliense]MDN3624852.1 M15 family metallopeptidase [Methylobacterium isbiliense]GJD98115.1 hypothetical protein GMJLKIPL_0022 [Methylobacterium isbiliense]